MRRAWLDPRLVVGAVLVAASIAGVSLVVDAASRSTSVWVASGTLLPGDVVAASDVERRELRMDGAADVYLAAVEDPVGLVVVSTIAAGEALPTSALGDAGSIDRATVVLPLERGVASTIGRGSVVDVWAAAPEALGAFASPTVLVSDAVVVGLVEDEGLIADDAVRVEVLVPRRAVADVLDAVANAHALSIVPVADPVAP